MKLANEKNTSAQIFMADGAIIMNAEEFHNTETTTLQENKKSTTSEKIKNKKLDTKKNVSNPLSESIRFPSKKINHYYHQHSIQNTFTSLSNGKNTVPGVTYEPHFACLLLEKKMNICYCTVLSVPIPRKEYISDKQFLSSIKIRSPGIQASMLPLHYA